MFKKKKVKRWTPHCWWPGLRYDTLICLANIFQHLSDKSWRSTWNHTLRETFTVCELENHHWQYINQLSMDHFQKPSEISTEHMYTYIIMHMYTYICMYTFGNITSHSFMSTVKHLFFYQAWGPLKPAFSKLLVSPVPAGLMQNHASQKGPAGRRSEIFPVVDDDIILDLQYIRKQWKRKTHIYIYISTVLSNDSISTIQYPVHVCLYIYINTLEISQVVSNFRFIGCCEELGSFFLPEAVLEVSAEMWKTCLGMPWIISSPTRNAQKSSA